MEMVRDPYLEEEIDLIKKRRQISSLCDKEKRN